ncbi:MAG: glutamate 5-kinase [Deferribacteraceae bacterium]|jgi:glutamate 5-kinase|nr:glutamate 5-kinase [Deferribacteraceae bacterium]
MRERKLPRIENLVIKIGSNLLTDGGGVSSACIARLVDAIAEVKKEIDNISIVSSGAIACGFKELGFKKRPVSIMDKQASAAVGQSRLIWFYEHAFQKHSLTAAQILITKFDFSNRSRYINARSTIYRLHKLGVIPIINENDVLVANELKYVESFGDNDNLGALVAALINSDMLMILSDVDGLFTKDPVKYPDAEIIHSVEGITPEILELADGTSSIVGTGGMYSKLKAAEHAQKNGCPVAIIGGNEPENIKRFLAGELIGTYFEPAKRGSGAKKRWIAGAAIPKGVVFVNEGAKEAILRHNSLLAVGVTEIDGKFEAGDIVRIETGNNAIALGKVRFDSETLNMIKQKSTSEASLILGKDTAVVIHCDDMGML